MSFVSLGPIVAKLAWWLALAAPYVAVGALVVSIIAVAYAIALKWRFKRLALGRNGSIEESVSILARDMKEIKKFRSELETYLKVAETRLQGTVSGVGVVRFNPFSGDGSGGNQSFAAAFLDEGGNGVVFSSLYARDRVGLYAKPIEKGISSYELTGEEKEAIAQAKQSIANRKKK
ncbi:hypothetical protein A2943_02905 [Candidatus Adlerbacteria bacterium RIFCSPLOWO2_01_FULL_51_16]|uniref:DUF4446 domain-containing protein n=1 Tax=Candidatus Adlerbacteria bacterium RIFCSPLOWO2_01_FULL_51_16 TaxID=1797243 RepID=A0A1F4XGP1_9BACT|nr:MAG: hypothetical protein A2943_02905 [Candidatus Adlerbacteria bacterium RIFCSPLOWO2_01_FULL_51_16]